LIGQKMKILILNGSPKGENSISLFYAKYVMNQFPDISFEVRHPVRDIRSFEKNKEKIECLVKEIRSADGILWVTPVYVLSVPGQLMKLYELIESSGYAHVFEGKYVSAICSSMNYFDHNALHYLQAKTEDAKGNFIEGFSVSMFDIKKTEVRKNLKLFFSEFIYYLRENNSVTKRFFNSKLSPENGFIYSPDKSHINELSHPYKIVILTNATKSDNNLLEMIQVFQMKAGLATTVINVNEIELKGGCLGCLKCSQIGNCVYNDEYEKYKPIIKEADSLIYALKIENRAFGSKFKMFVDRNFSNGHRVKKNFYTGFLISGNYSQEIHAQNIVDGINYGGKSSFEGNVVSDEYRNTEIITELIRLMAEKVIRCMSTSYSKPPNFYGVAAHKIFRDLVYATRSLQRADDKFYRKNGLYDFPTRDYKTRLLNSFIRIITTHPAIRKSFYRKINTLMVKDFERMVTKTEKK